MLLPDGPEPADELRIQFFLQPVDVADEPRGVACCIGWRRVTQGSVEFPRTAQPFRQSIEPRREVGHDKRFLPERARARIILTRDPDGEERCVSCYLCAAACPVSCISMEGEERADGRRWARWFRINFARCIYCGLCEEACPTLAIQLTPDYEFCKYDILDMVYEKEDLLISGPGKYPGYNFYRVAGLAVGGGVTGGAALPSDSARRRSRAAVYGRAAHARPGQG